MSKLNNCRVCHKDNLKPFLDLGAQPWANDFVPYDRLHNVPEYPLSLVQCIECNTVQLDYTVPKGTMFGDHTYRSGMTKTLVNHFEEVAAEIDNFTSKNMNAKYPAVLDIGSNDGAFLSVFPENWNVLGVESSKSTASFANDQGIKTLNEFYNLETAKKIGTKFQAIHASGVFFHLEELDSVCEGIKFNLADDGIFVVQCIYWDGMKKSMAFDQIYHEHLLYYNLETLTTLLNRFSMDCFDIELSPIHGGSLIVKCCHMGVYNKTDTLKAFAKKEADNKTNEFAHNVEFADRVRLEIDQLKKAVAKLKADQKTIYGLGAPVKGNTLLNACGFTNEDIDCLVEINTAREGLYAPGSNIPVRMESEIKSAPDVYLVLAWNFKKEILERHKEDVKNGVEFLFPVIT